MVIAFALCAVAIIIGAFIIFAGFKGHKKNKGVIERLATQLSLGRETSRTAAFEEINYLGGHPMLPKPGNALISFRERGFVIVAGGKATASPYKVIKVVDLMSQEQVSRDVTLTRFLALGVLSLGAKKKTVTTDSYCRIVIELKGIESAVLLKAKSAGNIASLMNFGRIATTN